MIGQGEGKTISRIFHPGDPFVACDARIKHSVGVIETDFQVLLNSLIESSIYEAFGMLFLSLQISSAFYRQSC
jgi:hypothetical protein